MFNIKDPNEDKPIRAESPAPEKADKEKHDKGDGKGRK